MSLRERRAAKKLRREAPRKKAKGSASSSESGGEEEHELFYYAGDRVQLMKEVLKVLKSKKIKSLAPDSMKDLDMEEINTMLLEELLGISNKRLKKILDGQNADDESSSSSEDGEKTEKHIDIISLDDVSDDDLCLIEDGPTEKNKKDPNNDKTKNSKKHRIKKEPREKRVKEEPATEKEKLLSVLELLELQARARAIRSQIALETENRPKELIPAPADDESDGDAVIVEVIQPPKEIVISSSDSETDNNKNGTVNGKIKAKSDKTNKTSCKKSKKQTNNSDENAGSNETTEKSIESDPKTTSETNPKNVTEGTNSDTTVQIISDIPLPAAPGGEQNEDRNSPKRFGDTGNKTDSEDDVIHLDVVEIEGIDD